MSSLDYFANKAIANNDVTIPEWISSKNKSLEAFEAIMNLKGKYKDFIINSHRKSDFKKKSSWQISGSKVAKLIGAKPPSILHNTTYSPHLRDFLAKINEELNSLKIKQIEGIENRKKRGVSAHRKDELLSEIKSLKSRVKEIEQLNAKEQVQEVGQNLSLPIRVKLGWT